MTSPEDQHQLIVSDNPLPPYTKHELDRWARLVKIRDGGRCVMCTGRFDVWTSLQAHHVWPKSKFPELALNLDNGVTLCTGCHLQLVHGGNSILDIRAPMEESRWFFYEDLFTPYLSGSAFVAFHANRQVEVYSRERREALRLST